MVAQRLPVDTGVSDPVYDLILVLQQALADCHRYAHFAEDARAAGDDELVALFEELAENDRQLGRRITSLLNDRLVAA